MIETMTPPRRNRALTRLSRAACAGVLALAPLLAPVAALAQEEEIKKDARMEGYAEKVTVDNDSTALMWLLLILVGAIGFSVTFKNARRTHLD